jgi:carbamate kinase
MTEGQLGSLLALAIRESCGDRVEGVVGIVTHVVVDRSDPGFENPAKPIGPFYSSDEAAVLERSRGWEMVDDAGRGMRRVVPSPEPLAVLESGAVRALLDGNQLVVACGGGGVPVTRGERGYQGVEAVVDKDRAAQLLAASIGADALVFVTGIDAVRLDFGKPTERSVHMLSASEAQRHLVDGQFPSGSMGPKIEASIRFVRRGGRLAAITTPELVLSTLEGRPASGHGGTVIMNVKAPVTAA